MKAGLDKCVEKVLQLEKELAFYKNAYERRYTCPTCLGLGVVQQTDIDYDQCRTCNGTGRVAFDRPV